MIVQQTLGTLRALKLEGMASAFEEQLTLPTSGQLAFEDRLALLVERESAWRSHHRLKRLLAGPVQNSVCEAGFTPSHR